MPLPQGLSSCSQPAGAPALHSCTEGVGEAHLFLAPQSGSLETGAGFSPWPRDGRYPGLAYTVFEGTKAGKTSASSHPLLLEPLGAPSEGPGGHLFQGRFMCLEAPAEPQGLPFAAMCSGGPEFCWDGGVTLGSPRDRVSRSLAYLGRPLPGSFQRPAPAGERRASGNASLALSLGLWPLGPGDGS